MLLPAKIRCNRIIAGFRQKIKRFIQKISVQKPIILTEKAFENAFSQMPTACRHLFSRHYLWEIAASLVSFGQKHGRLARLQRFAILPVSSCSDTPFIRRRRQECPSPRDDRGRYVRGIPQKSVNSEKKQQTAVSACCLACFMFTDA